MASLAHVGLGVVAGALAGFLLGRLAAPSAASGAPLELGPAPRVTGREAPPRAEPLELAREERAPERASEREGLAVDAPPPDGGALISQALREHAAREITAGWSSERRDALPDDKLAEGLVVFEHTVLELVPERLGVELGRRANQGDGAVLDFLAHDPIALLDRLQAEGVGPRLEFVTDAAGYEALFPTSSGRSVDGVANKQRPDDALEDGSQLVFPAGVFRLDGLMRTKDPFPSDVTIAGAGMNATLLIFGDLSTREELRNLTIRDCTVHTDSNYLFDLRRRPASVRLERVRAIGFDMGAGSSCMFGARGLALLVRDSRIEGGYGRNPGYGTLFDVRSDALLARFENTTIDGVSLGVRGARPGSSLVFVNCDLIDLTDREDVQAPVERTAFVGCRIDYLGKDEKVEGRDLNDLFPDWKQRSRE